MSVPVHSFIDMLAARCCELGCKITQRKHWAPGDYESEARIRDLAKRQALDQIQYELATVVDEYNGPDDGHEMTVAYRLFAFNRKDMLELMEQVYMMGQHDGRRDAQRPMWISDDRCPQ